MRLWPPRRFRASRESTATRSSMTTSRSRRLQSRMHRSSERYETAGHSVAWIAVRSLRIFGTFLTDVLSLERVLLTPQENQRAAEARAMSASRSKGDPRDEYLDDYSNAQYDEPPLPAQQSRAAASARPMMQQQQQPQAMGRAAPANVMGGAPMQGDRRAVAAAPARSAGPPGGKSVSYAEESQSYGAGPPSSSGSSSVLQGAR